MWDQQSVDYFYQKNNTNCALMIRQPESLRNSPSQNSHPSALRNKYNINIHDNAVAWFGKFIICLFKELNYQLPQIKESIDIANVRQLETDAIYQTNCNPETSMFMFLFQCLFCLFVCLDALLSKALLLSDSLPDLSQLVPATRIDITPRCNVVT